MKNKNVVLSILILALFVIGACSNAAPADTQATIDAAVQATSNARATIQVAVQATTTQVEGASQSAIATAVQATLTAQPTPDYANLSEEELAALIDDAVNKAMTDAATTTTTTTTTTATSDGAITSDEVAATTQDVYQACYEIAYAEELIAAYEQYYGEYVDEALASLNAIEDDLAAISESLAQINDIMTQGAETASAAIEQLNAAADQIKTKTDAAQAKAQGWKEQVSKSVAARESDLLKIKPTDVTADKIGALTQAHDFLDAFKKGLADGKFSPAELQQIGQLGANAHASLLKTGDPQFQKFGNSIEGLTRNAARGELGSARKGVGNLERSMPTRPPGGRRR